MMEGRVRPRVALAMVWAMTFPLLEEPRKGFTVSVIAKEGVCRSRWDDEKERAEEEEEVTNAEARDTPRAAIFKVGAMDLFYIEIGPELSSFPLFFGLWEAQAGQKAKVVRR